MIARAVVDVRERLPEALGSDAEEIRTVHIDSTLRFTELRSAWDSLLQSSEAASPFLTWE